MALGSPPRATRGTPLNTASDWVTGQLVSTTSAQATAAARACNPRPMASSEHRSPFKRWPMVSGRAVHSEAGQSSAPPFGANTNNGPSPEGRSARALSRIVEGRASRKPSAFSSQPRGLRYAASRWEAQPSCGCTSSVLENPLAAIRVGMWLMESIRFTCCPSAKFRHT